MKKSQIIKLVCLTTCLAGINQMKISAATTTEEKRIQIPVETVVDKIRGGVLGQMIGNLNGLPYEFKYTNEPGNVRNYIPSLPNGAETDDDTDFEWVYIYEMQKTRNIFLSPDEIVNLWKEKINRGMWCANLYARTLMDIGIKPPYTGYAALNPWSDFNISGQFLCETYGLTAPAMPQTAAKIGLNYTTVAIDMEPAQTTVLFTTMISTAFVESDINKILDAGMAALDPKSNTLKLIKDVRKWHGQYPNDWRKTRSLLKEKYSRENGDTRDVNGTELNTGVIIIALLYGEGDFQETIKLGMSLGYDADCNSATLGTIIGTTYGYRKMMSQGWQIIDRYKNTSRDKMPMDETITSFADRVIEVFEMVNENNGGKKIVVNNTRVYEIPSQKPAPVMKLSSFEEQNTRLRSQYTKQITADLLSGKKADTARAAYLAVCLDMDQELSKQYPKEWKAAANNLRGYWKIIGNIYEGYFHFKRSADFQKKFAAAGFKNVNINEKYSAEERKKLPVWMDPAELY